MKYILAIITVFISTLGFSQTKISVEEASKQLSKRKNKIQLVDVRTTKEFETKHLKNAIHADWINQEHYSENTKNLNKKKPVYVYCLSGGRSAKAAKALADQGYKVFEIDGGIMKWEAADLPLIKKEENISNLSKKQFQEIIEKNKIVLVDFYAEWCGPCKKMEPIINDIAKKHEGRIKVIKIDTDKNSSLAKDLNITSIPYFAIYKDGKLTWKHNGQITQELIEQNL